MTNKYVLSRSLMKKTTLSYTSKLESITYKYLLKARYIFIKPIL